MNNYVLSTCSTLDLSAEYVKKRNIEYIKFVYLTDGKENLDDLGQTVSFADFYQMMRDGVDTKTSQPNVDDYKIYFEKFLSEGKDVIHLNLSSGLSGAQTSAKIAREDPFSIFQVKRNNGPRVQIPLDPLSWFYAVTLTIRWCRRWCRRCRRCRQQSPVRQKP